MSIRKKTYDSLDLLKFILSLLVVALHFDPTGGNLKTFPVFMLPVPLFFVISGFLFFRGTTPDTKRLLKFVSRNMKLYLAYFLLFLPYYALSWWNAWFSRGIFFGLKTLLVKFCFGSTFLSSWYLVALTIGVAAVYFLSKTRMTWLPLAVGGLLLVICMLQTCYGNLLDLSSSFLRVIDRYPGTFYQSFPIALFWVALGKCMADCEQRLIDVTTPVKIFLVALSALLFVSEYVIIKLSGIYAARGYCITMIPLCIAIFVAFLGMDATLKKPKLLREFSTVTYCAHTTIGQIFTLFLVKMGLTARFPWSLLLYVLIIFLCMAGTLIVSALEKTKFFKWCKYFK